MNLAELSFGLSLTSAISINGIARLVGFIRRILLAVEDVVRTNEKQLRSRMDCGFCNVHRAIGVHRQRKIWIDFTTIDIGVCGRERNPLRLGFFYYSLNLLEISNIGLCAAQCGKVITGPLP